MPTALAQLLAELSEHLKDVTLRLRDDDLTIEEWQAEILRLLAQYMSLAMMKGLGRDELSAEQQTLVADRLRVQSDYLHNFANTVRETGWEDKYTERAQTYAESIAPLFEQGRTYTLSLPAYPKDGSSECLFRCGCRWDIEWLNEMQGNARAYWIRSKDDSCPTCIQRQQDWHPLYFEQGEPINP